MSPSSSFDERLSAYVTSSDVVFSDLWSSQLSVGSLALPAFFLSQFFHRLSLAWRFPRTPYDVPRLLLPSEDVAHFQTMPDEVSQMALALASSWLALSLGSSPRQFCILAWCLVGGLRPTMSLRSALPPLAFALHLAACTNLLRNSSLISPQFPLKGFLQPLHWLLCRGTLSLCEWSPRIYWIWLSVLSHGIVLGWPHRVAKHCCWRDWLAL